MIGSVEDYRVGLYMGSAFGASLASFAAIALDLRRRDRDQARRDRQAKRAAQTRIDARLAHRDTGRS